MAKAPAEIKSLARSHTVMAVNTLKGIAQSSKAPAAARVAAAEALLNRGWGKAAPALPDLPEGASGRVVFVMNLDGD